jgi:hypothetical protein
MAKVTIKGHEFEAITIRDSFSRRAVQFKNNILATLKKIGIPNEDVKLELEPVAFKKLPASVTWWGFGHRMHYSYQLANKYVDNLYVISKLIEIEINALLTEKITLDEFIAEFKEDKDVEESRKEAREVLGLSHDTLDFEAINKAYKDLAREHHPDMPNGDVEKFKSLNKAHKILKRELQ